MESKEKIEKALQLEKVDQIPIYENFITMSNAQRLVDEVISQKHLEIMRSDESAHKKNEKHQELLETGLEKELEIARKAGIDGLSIAIHPEVKWITPHKLKTEFGRIYRPNPNLLGYAAIDMLAQGEEEGAVWLDTTVKRIEDLLELDLNPKGNSRLLMLEKFSDAEVLPIPELLMFQRVWSLFGYDQFIKLLKKEQFLLKTLLKKWRNYNITAIEILDQLGYDIVFYGDDFASTTGGLYPIEEFKEFIKPYLQDIVDACQNRGIQVILHSCGDINRYMEDIIEIGFDGLHPLEPPMMDFEALKTSVGDQICLIGNIDARTTLINGTVEEVREETKKKIQVGQLKGHILSASHSVHPGVKFDNWMAMIEAAKEFGTRDWVEKNPPGELPTWSPPEYAESIPDTWEEVLEERRQNLLDPADVYVASQRHHKPEDQLRSDVKIGIGTVATPHEAGRKIVASCLRASGFKVEDLETIVPKNCIKKFRGFDIALLSLVKNPQAIAQTKLIGKRLKKFFTDIKIVVGGGALNRLLNQYQKDTSPEEAREKIKEMCNADAFGIQEIDIIDIMRELSQTPEVSG